MNEAMALAATMPFWLAGEQAERERAARGAALVAEARRGGQPATPRPPRRSLVPRLAGALGLF